MKHIKLFENFSKDGGYDLSKISRDEVAAIIDLLDSNDISYDLDGPNDKIEFDITEFSKTDQDAINKILGLK